MCLSLYLSHTSMHAHTCAHPHTQTQVPLSDKRYVEVLASSARPHHIMGNPVSSSDPQFALIATTCSKALNPCVTARPWQLCVRDHL